MTYSIVALDPTTGHLGVAVASRFFAVGALVPHIRGGKGAVATQAFVNPLWGLEGASRLAVGEAPTAIIADFVARDAGAAHRQAHMIDAEGRIAAHTGAQCDDWAGNVSAEGVSVAGNMLTGPQVVTATLTAYVSHPKLPLAERLMTAMEAGAIAGGDKRGTQSAALRIHRSEEYPWLDIRADDHPDPLAELRRLYDVANERFLHVAETMATRSNFSGLADRSTLDAAILAEEKRRKKLGIRSKSFATELPSE